LTVIDAIAAGQRAASSIRRFLRGEPFSQLVERNGYKPIAVSTALPTDEETQERARIKAPQISLRDMKSTFKEATLCYGLEEAQKEASRCLRCDLEIGG
jgi:NADH-quinone oxidoreductase subunit F